MDLKHLRESFADVADDGKYGTGQGDSWRLGYLRKAVEGFLVSVDGTDEWAKPLPATPFDLSQSCVDWTAWYEVANGITVFDEADGDTFNVTGHLNPREAVQVILMYQRGKRRGEERGRTALQLDIKRLLDI